MRQTTKQITQGAMITAITAIILILNRQTGGIMESSFYWFLSFPILIYAVRSELKMTIMVGIACMFMALLFSTPQTMFYLFSALTTGSIYGYGVKRKWSNSKLLLWTFITTFISCYITMFALASAFGYNIIEGRMELLELIEPFTQFLPMSAQLFVKTFDILLSLLIIALQTLCTHLVAVILFRKLGIECNPIRTVMDWQPPLWTAILTMIAHGLFIMMSFISLSESMQELILFVMLGGMSIYLIYGLIIVRILAFRKKAMMLLYIPIFWLFVVYIGLFDTITKGKLKREGRLWIV